MRYLQLLLLVVMLTLSGFNATAATLDERIAEAQKLIRTRVENKWNMGIVVGIIDETGTRVAAYGTGKKDSEQKLDAETLFEIGSITKTFTGILLADMAEQGEVKLDDPVAKFLPADVKVPEKNGKKITLQNLSQHTSGLPRLPGNFKPADPHDPYADYTIKQMYEFLAKCELTSEIGEKYDYSNLAVGLLGHALSLKAGKDYEALVESRICGPLSLKSTRITLTPALKARLATG
jgi:serine-type D-Ala-D-Ala carboxypeptidase/endopeptidase